MASFLAGVGQLSQLAKLWYNATQYDQHYYLSVTYDRSHKLDSILRPTGGPTLLYCAYLWSHESPRETGVNLFTLTSLATKQNVYYERL